jgi:hypothetical protein
MVCTPSRGCSRFAGELGKETRLRQAVNESREGKVGSCRLKGFNWQNQTSPQMVIQLRRAKERNRSIPIPPFLAGVRKVPQEGVNLFLDDLASISR